MVVVDRPPPVNSSGMVERAASLNMRSARSPQGGMALLVFTDGTQALKRYGPTSEAGIIALASRDVLGTALRGSFDGVLINPAGPWAYVPRSVVQQILG